MSDLSVRIWFIIANILTSTPIWTMQSEVLIETEQKDDAQINTVKNFTTYLRLKKSSDKKITIIDAGHVDYFMYPRQKECYVLWLTILPLFRKQKLGTRLMLEVKQHAQKVHCDHIRLLARTGYESPIPFYEKLGFVVIKDDDCKCKTLELILPQK